MTRWQRENLTYSFIALASIAMLIWVIPAQMPPYPGYGVEASLLPNVSVGIILALSLLALGRNALAYWIEKEIDANDTTYPDEEQSGSYSQVGRVHLWHLAKFLVPCALLMPAMQWTGFIPAGIAFLLLIQYLCGQRRLLISASVAIVSVLLVHSAMTYVLRVPLP